MSWTHLEVASWTNGRLDLLHLGQGDRHGVPRILNRSRSWIVIILAQILPQSLLDTRAAPLLLDRLDGRHAPPMQMRTRLVSRRRTNAASPVGQDIVRVDGGIDQVRHVVGRHGGEEVDGGLVRAGRLDVARAEEEGGQGGTEGRRADTNWDWAERRDSAVE